MNASLMKFYLDYEIDSLFTSWIPD